MKAASEPVKMDMITILLQEIGVQWLGVDQIRSWNGYLTGGHIDKVSCKFAFKLWMKNVTRNSSTWLCLEIGYPRSHVHTFPPWNCHKNGHSGCIPHSQTQDNSRFCFIVFLESWNPWPQGSMICKRASSTTPVAMAVAMDWTMVFLPKEMARRLVDFPQIPVIFPCTVLHKQIIFTPWLLHVSRTLLTCIKQVAQTEQEHTKPYKTQIKILPQNTVFPTKQRRNRCFSWHQPIPSCFGLVWNPRIQANIGWLVLRYQSYPLFGS